MRRQCLRYTVGVIAILFRVQGLSDVPKGNAYLRPGHFGVGFHPAVFGGDQEPTPTRMDVSDDLKGDFSFFGDTCGVVLFVLG